LEGHGERVQEGRVAGRGAGPVAQDDVARCEAERVHVPLRTAELWGRPRLEDGEGGAWPCSSVWVFVEEVDVLNTLMNMYAKCRYVVAARKVFDNMVVMDFISWNTMIAGHFEMVTAIQGWSCFLLYVAR
jgi:pentatricopeptide repeat protein